MSDVIALKIALLAFILLSRASSASCCASLSCVKRFSKLVLAVLNVPVVPGNPAGIPPVVNVAVLSSINCFPDCMSAERDSQLCSAAFS